jgi:hypothetical protein
VVLPIALAGASGLVSAGPAVAAGGDNGKVKIHESTTSETDVRDEPKVCEFYVVGFGFDADHDVHYAIVPGPPFKDPPVASGDIDIDGQGHGRSGDLTLPNGQYKLLTTFVGENGHAKHKVFKVDCPPPEEPAETPTPTPTETATEVPEPTVTATESPTATTAGQVKGVFLPPDVDDAFKPRGGVRTGGGGTAGTAGTGASDLPLVLFGGGLLLGGGMALARARR